MADGGSASGPHVDLRRWTPFATTDVADALSKLNIHGYLDGVVMWSPQYCGGDTKIVGPAHTVQMVPAAEKPVKLSQHHVDATPPGAVVVIACPAGLMTARAKALGAVGVVTDGRVRDLEEQRSQAFPVFARSLSCHGMGGFVAPTSFGEPIEIAGVRIAANDLVLADINGVVIVPQNRADEVLAECARAKPIEEACMHDLLKGHSIQATFVKHRGRW